MRTQHLRQLQIRISRLFAADSLRNQLLSRSLCILAVLLLLIGLSQYFIMREFIFENKAASMQSQILSIPRDVWKKLTASTAEGNPGRPAMFLQESSFAFIEPNGQLTSLSEWPDSRRPLQLSSQQYTDAMQLKQQRRPIHTLKADDRGIEQLVVLQPVSDRGQLLGLVQVSTDTTMLKDVLVRQLMTFVFLSAAALIAGLLVFLPALRRTLDPLTNMTEAVERVTAGNLTERFPVGQGQAEIDRLALSFNGMLERLDASFEAEREAKERMRRFVADASHELRTPLTSIHGYLEVLLRGAAFQQDQLVKALNSMHGESGRLRKLVENLLQLVKLERASVMKLSVGPLAPILHEMEPQLRVLAGSRRVDFNIASGLNCRRDPEQIKQVVLHLFQNAVQHTEAGAGRIMITLGPSAGGVLLSVQDNGTGIGSEHLPYVFDRFYRSDSSRARIYGGDGLGLSITQSIVEAHGGLVSASSSEGAGSTFHVWLPLSVQTK